MYEKNKYLIQYMDFEVYYGKAAKNVTDIVLHNLYNAAESSFLIPSGRLLRQRLFGQLQGPADDGSVKVTIGGSTSEFTENQEVIIDINTYTANVYNYQDMRKSLKFVQDSLKIVGGNFQQELKEQEMAFRFIKPHHKVLEIGGNIGRNSVIIASILGLEKNDSNLLVLECDETSAQVLTRNRDLNSQLFKIEASALSKKKLIQKGWTCTVSDTLLPGFKWVPIIDWSTLSSKYNIEFDTLVLDCEGAFYYILHDFPEILEGIKLIILENDFIDPLQKTFVDQVLKENDFVEVFAASLIPPPPDFAHVKDVFYQVWKKRETRKL